MPVTVLISRFDFLVLALFSGLESLEFLIHVLRNHYGISLDRVIRHRDVPGKNTECPGNYFPWDEFKRRLKASN